MTPFALDQWLILALVLVLGLLIGMFIMAGGKWKRLYREEAARAQALDAENKRLRGEAREMDSLRQAAARDRVRDPERGDGPV